MDCTFIRLYLEAYGRGQLNKEQEEGIIEHLAICQGCWEEYEEIKAVNAMFGKGIPNLPRDFTHQVMAKIQECEMVERGKDIWQEIGSWGISFIAAGLIMLLLNFTTLGSEISTIIANVDRNPIEIQKIVEYSPVNIFNRGLDQVHQLLRNLEIRR